MVANNGVMSNVAAAPNNDIVADRRVRLDNSARQDEAMLADVFGIDDGTWVDEGDETVTAGLAFEVAITPEFGSSVDN